MLRKKGKKNNKVAMKTGGKAGFYELLGIKHLHFCFSFRVDKRRFQHETDLTNAPTILSDWNDSRG